MTRRLAALGAVLALACWAWWPLASAGPLGEDLATFVALARLLRGDETLDAAALYSLPGAEGRPLGALALLGLARVLADDGRFGGAQLHALRAVDLALLAGAAFGLARLLRRALAPRLGVECARATGWAAAALLVCHPLCVPLVAHPARLGDLLGLALAALAAHAFLKGRHERRRGWLVLAATLTALCGFASELATFLALSLALIELTLERRARPLAVRLRTAATTLVLFGAAATLELAWRTAAGLEPSAPHMLEVLVDESGGPSLARALSAAVEKLGLLVMPVPGQAGLPSAGLVVGGAALLVALEPALVAARTAPRLWGGLLGLWLLGLALVELSGAGLRVDPATLDGVEILFPAVVLVAAGLGTASAAVAGARRRLAPLAAALGYALLAHATASAWPEASRALLALRTDLARAREAQPAASAFVLLDPPERVRGLEVCAPALEVLGDPAVGGAPEAVAVRGLAAPALGLWSRQAEFARWRARGLVLVTPAELLGLAAPRDDGTPPARGRRVALRVAEPDPAPAALLWRGDARSPLVELDPLALRAARVAVRAGRAEGEPPRLHWRAREEQAAGGELAGTWILGREGPVALFDLDGSLAWLCGGRIARLWLDEEPLSAEVLPGLPADLRVTLGVEGEDWILDLGEAAPPEAPGPAPTWRLELLALDRLTHQSLPLEREGPGRLRAAGAARFAARAARAGASVAWALELRGERGALARALGRLEP